MVDKELEGETLRRGCARKWVLEGVEFAQEVHSRTLLGDGDRLAIIQAYVQACGLAEIAAAIEQADYDLVEALKTAD